MKTKKPRTFDLANFSATNIPLVLLLVISSLIIIELIIGLDPNYNLKTMYEYYFNEVQDVVFSKTSFESSFLILASFIFGIKQFRFTNKKALGYTTLALPKKRRKIFNKSVIPVITVLSIVTLLSKLFVLIVNVQRHGFSSELLLNSFSDFLICFMAIFIGFTASAAASVFTGKLAEAIVSGYAILRLPAAITAVVETIFSALLYGYTDSFTRSDATLTIVSLLNPLGIITYPSYNYYFGGVEYYGNTTTSLVGSILWIAISVTGLALIKKHFVKSFKAECIGFKTINKPMTLITSISISFYIAIEIITLTINNYLASNTLSDGMLYYKPVATIIIFVVTAIITGYLINSLLTTSISFTKEKLKLIIAPISIVAVLSVFALTNGFGHYNKIPKAEKIESVTVLSTLNYNTAFSSLEGHDFEYSYMSSCNVFTTENDIKVIQGIHQTALDSRDKDTNESIQIIYLLKNGKSVYRTYYLASNELSESLFALWETDEFQRLKTDAFVNNAPTNKDLYSFDETNPSENGFILNSLYSSSAYSYELYDDKEKKDISCFNYKDSPTVNILRKDATFKELTDLSENDFNKIKAAIYKDMTETSGEEWFKPKKSYGAISFTYPYDYFSGIYHWEEYEDEYAEDEETEFDFTYDFLDYEESIEIYVTSSTPNTVKVLKELGLFKVMLEKGFEPTACYVADVNEISRWYNVEDDDKLICHSVYFTPGGYGTAEAVIDCFSDPNYYEESYYGNIIIDQIYEMLLGGSALSYPTTKPPAVKIENKEEITKLINSAHLAYYIGDSGQFLVVEYENDNFECFVIPEN